MLYLSLSRCLKRISKNVAQIVRSSSVETPGIMPDASDYERHSMRKRFHLSARSHTCGELRLKHVGSSVLLCGWVHRVRLSRFLLLRDSYGLIQVVVDSDHPDNKTCCFPSPESVVQVTGTVAARPPKDINETLPTGHIEVLANHLTVLNSVSSHLPFLPSDHMMTNETLRLKNRFLELRFPYLQRNLKFRSDLLLNIRQFLATTYGFIEIETPYLFRKTPGGAREFIIPTSHSGLFYSLPQSPQQFKQLLIIGGVDRYMQIARCFRDESSRSDRQPEFTQLDLEMAFVTSEDIMSVIDELLCFIWPLIQNIRPEQALPQFPIPRIPYSSAMSLYGSDKPDIRFDMRFCCPTVDNVVGFKIISNLAALFSVNDWQKLQQQIHSTTGVIIVHSQTSDTQSPDIAPLVDAVEANTKDTVVYVRGSGERELKALGLARVLIASLLDSQGVPVYKPGIHFLWVHDFPLFERTDEDSWISVHHPFTAPTPETLSLVYSDPDKVISQHYDLVCNGQEVGGGSIRIHDAALQEHVLSVILKEDISTMDYFLKALSYGAPPHGGIALGLDRLVAIFLNASSIRDVIAFPKVADGKDLLCGAPSKISQADLQYYRITLKD